MNVTFEVPPAGLQEFALKNVQVFSSLGFSFKLLNGILKTHKQRTKKRKIVNLEKV